MAKKRPNGRRPKSEWVEFKDETGQVQRVRRAAFIQLKKRITQEVEERIRVARAEYDTQLDEFKKITKKKQSEVVWEGRTQISWRGLLRYHRLAKVREKEFELAKTVLEQFQAYGELVQFDKGLIGWAMVRVTEAPRDERMALEKASAKSHRYGFWTKIYDHSWARLVRLVELDLALNSERQRLFELLEKTKNEMGQQKTKFREMSGGLYQAYSMGRIDKETFEAERFQFSKPYLHKKLNFDANQENWWIFWHNVATKAYEPQITRKLLLPKSFITELARRRHNAT